MKRNHVSIYVWLPRGSSPGHAALRTYRDGPDNMGFYISFYAAEMADGERKHGAATKKGRKEQNFLRFLNPNGVRSCLPFSTYDAEVHYNQEEARKQNRKGEDAIGDADIIIELYTLDVDLIHAKWECLKARNLKYTLAAGNFFLKKENRYNCLTLVGDLLKAGKINRSLLSKESELLLSKTRDEVAAGIYDIYYTSQERSAAFSEITAKTLPPLMVMLCIGIVVGIFNYLSYLCGTDGGLSSYFLEWSGTSPFKFFMTTSIMGSMLPVLLGFCVLYRERFPTNEVRRSQALTRANQEARKLRLCRATEAWPIERQIENSTFALTITTVDEFASNLLTIAAQNIRVFNLGKVIFRTNRGERFIKNYTTRYGSLPTVNKDKNIAPTWVAINSSYSVHYTPPTRYFWHSNISEKVTHGLRLEYDSNGEQSIALQLYRYVNRQDKVTYSVSVKANPFVPLYQRHRERIQRAFQQAEAHSPQTTEQKMCLNSGKDITVLSHLNEDLAMTLAERLRRLLMICSDKVIQPPNECPLSQVEPASSSARASSSRDAATAVPASVVFPGSILR